MKCGWHIEAPSGLLVRLYGFSYLIENTPDCSKESLTFYDGADSSGKVLLQLCKTLSKYFSIYSSGNVIFVQLQTAVGSNGTKVMMRYKAVAPNLDPGCTGGNPVKRIIQVKKPSVSVSNPFEPFDLPVNWQCNWIIEAPQGHIVKMKFEERFFFRRPECYSTADANYTFYKIYNSNETDSEMLLSCQLLNKLGSDPLYSSGRYLYIQLTSRKDWTLANEYADLKIAFEPVPVGTSCSTSNSAIQNENIVLSNASGTITSPGFPTTQPSGLKCGWKISVPKGNAIKLDFISFKLGNWRAYNNEVIVYADHFKSQSSLFRAYNKKPSFVSFSPHRFALIELDLVDKVTGEYGMRVMYKPVRQINSEKCNSGNGATIDVFGSEGVFISPENYSNKKTCRWNITVPVGHVVKLLAHRTLGSECSRSGKVYNGGNTASKILGDLCFDTSPMYSNGRHVLVEFKGIGQSGQFFGYFEAVKAAPLSFACRGHKLKTLTAPSGGIASYSYPLLYPNEVFCKWKIEVALPKLVKLTFKNFSLQESSDCEKDYLLISGRSLPGFHEQKFCGNVKPADVISIDNEMEMQFRSDLVGRSEGFEATYEAIDDESWGNCSASGIEFNQPSGYFFSPRHPGFFPPGVICTWTITAPAGRHVRLQIKMKTMPSTCDSASVIIREGADRRGKLVKRVCDSLDPPVMFSKGNRFWVQFRSASGSKQYTSGFNASYEVVRSLPLSTACSSTNPFLTLEGTTGSLASDGYPNNYSNEADCSFRLKSPSSMDAIVLTFETFDLERSEDCEADYVEVYDSINAFGESMGRFCGSTIPEPLKSSGPYMAVRFKTNGSGRYPGFKANFSTKLSTKYTVIIAVCSTLGALLLLSGCCWVCKRVFDDSGNELSGGDYSGVPMVDIKQSGQQV